VKPPRLPTLAGIAQATGEVIVRFPGTILAAGVGTGTAITMMELEGMDARAEWLAGRILIAAALALPLTLALRLAGEARGISRAHLLGHDFFALVLALAYGWGVIGVWIALDVLIAARLALLGPRFLSRRWVTLGWA